MTIFSLPSLPPSSCMYTLTPSLTVSVLVRMLQPLCEMADKVKEEISLGYTDLFISDLNEQGEPLRTAQTQAFSDTGTKVF